MSFKYKNTFLITSSLFCSICSSIFEKPVFLECEHIFCKECINKYAGLYNKMNSFNCPNCRKLNSTKKINEEKILEEIIDNLQIYCKNRNYGCSWEGKRKNNHKCIDLSDNLKKKFKLDHNENSRYYDDDYENNKLIEECDKENVGDIMGQLLFENKIDIEFLKIIEDEKKEPIWDKNLNHLDLIADEMFSFLDENKNNKSIINKTENLINSSDKLKNTTEKLKNKTNINKKSINKKNKKNKKLNKKAKKINKKYL